MNPELGEGEKAPWTESSSDRDAVRSHLEGVASECLINLVGNFVPLLKAKLPYFPFSRRRVFSNQTSATGHAMSPGCVPVLPIRLRLLSARG